MKKLSVPKVAALLREHDGNVAAVARAFGVTRTAVSLYIKAHPELIPVRDEAREVVKDDAESVLYRHLREGQAWAVCFYLKTQARDRGYFEKQEIEQTGGVKLQLSEEIIDAADDGPQDDPPAPGAV